MRWCGPALQQDALTRSAFCNSPRSCPAPLLHCHDHRAGEVLSEVRRGFDESRAAPDAYATKYALSDGRTRLKQLEEMLGLTR